jgi:hypothetical protein
MLEAIAEAKVLPHTRRSFIDHLVGTWRVLALWRQPREVCRAGLMHSGYATQFYPHAIFGLDERARVEALAGAKAERLIHLFSVLDRKALRAAVEARGVPDKGLQISEFRVPRRHALTAEEVAQLMAIEVANVAEQTARQDGSPGLWMSVCARWTLALRPVCPLPVYVGMTEPLGRDAEERARSKYLAAEGLGTLNPKELLEEAISENPWAAEPHLRWAQLAPRGAAARAAAKRARGLLLAWGTAWDKRLSWQHWLDQAKELA